TVLGITANSASGDFTWQLEDRNGFVGNFTAPGEVISYEPAADGDPIVSELISILAVQTATIEGKVASTVKLQTALHNVYDRASTSVCANVVRATHGQTIENEVLGGVDASRDQRRFMLRQGPLTYTSAIDAGQYIPDTLQVLVNGVPWHRVPTLYGAGSNQRAYVVQRDAQDVTWLSFGDGEQGAHLPSGREHITVTYRIGGGWIGNVSAQSLTTLRKRPPGVQKVTNPIPASGGVDGESLAQARVNAPLHAQQIVSRILSFNDFVYFARNYAGIGKVQVQSFSTGQRPHVLLTIASADGQPIDKESTFYQSFRQATIEATSWPARLIEIEPCEVLYFSLEASLVLASDYDEDLVKTSVVQKLSETFSFAQREIAQSVAASEVVASMQEVPGVVGVKLKSLFINEEPVALQSLLEARSGRSENGVLQPAQLLLIDADEQGIILNVE
ncbi:MAG TPA: putative baseplate assembly protein, partial [Ktedonobacteraceae bacterium]|nr:putative baseplate assembly protein [Ktedonobacteraceae bacterium]